MKVALDILGYAAASSLPLPLPDSRLCAVPEPGFHARKARLPGLAFELGQRALGGESLGQNGSVLFGTALGCLTETAAFVENLITEDGAAPKPRAFTASVHNAVASEVARKLGARGECQTFVQGELSHIAPLFAAARARARGSSGAALVGALDEWTPYVGRGRAACGEESAAAEGGALLHLAGAAGARPSLARVTQVCLGRPRDPRAWFEARAGEAQAVLSARAGLELAGARGIDASAFSGDFPAAGAVALALCVALLAGEAAPEDFGIHQRPARLAVLSASRFGEWGLVTVEAPRP